MNFSHLSAPLLDDRGTQGPPHTPIQPHIHLPPINHEEGWLSEGWRRFEGEAQHLEVVFHLPGLHHRQEFQAVAARKERGVEVLHNTVHMPVSPVLLYMAEVHTTNYTVVTHSD